jgi:hypothetical protein
LELIIKSFSFFNSPLTPLEKIKTKKSNLKETTKAYLNIKERKIFFELSLRLFFLQKKRITAIKRKILAGFYPN